MMHTPTQTHQAYPKSSVWCCLIFMLGLASGCGGCTTSPPQPKPDPTQKITLNKGDTTPQPTEPKEPCTEGEPCAQSLPASEIVLDRYLHTSSLLSNGTLLTIGGYTWDGTRRSVLSNVLAVIPGQNGQKGVASIAYPRWGHTATPLENNQLLVIGGSMDDPELSPFRQPPPELWSAAQQTWHEKLPPWEARFRHTATLLSDGTVLVVGGASSYEKSLKTVERYNPKTNTWEKMAPMDTTRYDHTTTLLQNGSMLVVGGRHGAGCGDDCAIDCIEDEDCGQHIVCADEFFCTGPLSSAALFDPQKNAWTTLPPLLEPRYDHTATLLPNGSVLIAGGRSTTGALSSALIFEPTRNAWMPVGSMSSARSGHTATLLPDGSVWLVGGRAPNTPGATCENGNPCPEDRLHRILASVERFEPSSRTWRSTTPLQKARYEHTATVLPDGALLVWGGSHAKRISVKGGERYNTHSKAWNVVD